MLVFQAAYRRAEVERTVVLSRSFFEIVVCKDKDGRNPRVTRDTRKVFLTGVPLYSKRFFNGLLTNKRFLLKDREDRFRKNEVVFFFLVVHQILLSNRVLQAPKE